MKTKDAPTLFADAPPGPSAGRCKGPVTLWIPEPQEKWVQPEMPGKRDDGTGKLWFED